MKDKKTLLFPTDFSPRASKALDQAIDFAQQFDYKLLIYHVYHRPIVTEGTSTTLLRQVEGKAEKNFQNLEKKHPNLKNVSYKCRKELGISIDSIVSTAKKEEAELIIMATKGAKGFGELWGTKTAKIIKSVSIPVLVIPDNSSISGIEKVGLACDYSMKTDYDQLSFLIKIAKKLKLDVDVITLNRDEKTMTPGELKNRELMKSQFKKKGTSFSFTFNNNIEEGIIKYCTQNDIGLIAILPKSYSYIRSIFHESLTEKMLFHSPLPLLVLK